MPTLSWQSANGISSTNEEYPFRNFNLSHSKRRCRNQEHRVQCDSDGRGVHNGNVSHASRLRSFREVLISSMRGFLSPAALECTFFMTKCEVYPLRHLLHAICGTKKYLSILFRAGKEVPNIVMVLLQFWISVRSTRGVAASLLACCRGSRIFRPCRCGDFGFVSRHKPAERRDPDVSASPDVVASCIASCRGGRVSFCLPHLLSDTLCKLWHWRS